MKIVLRKLENLVLGAPGIISWAECNQAVTRYGDMPPIYPLSDERDMDGSGIPVDRLQLNLTEGRETVDLVRAFQEESEHQPARW